jgi:hypothetical protein
MTEHEHDDVIDVIDLLRKARPEGPPQELVSPHAPAAQALLEEILSMDTIQPPETDTDAAAADGVVDLTRAPRRSRRRWLTVGGAVAAGVAVVVAVGTVVLNPADTTGAAADVDAALARSAQALDRSGRAEVQSHIVYDNARTDPLVEGGSDLWEFSGDDWSNTFEPDPGEVAAINRYVDGELYLYIEDRDGQFRWFHAVGEDMSGTWEVNPGTLLAEMEVEGDFEEVGDETMDGVPTRHLRATNPGDAEVPDLGGGLGSDSLGEVDGLEVWVDDDGFVRRIDISFAGEGELPDETIEGDAVVAVTEATVSARFSDFGEPIVIEAPTDYEDIGPEPLGPEG